VQGEDYDADQGVVCENGDYGQEGGQQGMTNEKCDNCGEMKANYSELQVSLVRTYRFCFECTQKIERILKEGVN
jgi:hypothetical protein